MLYKEKLYELYRKVRKINFKTLLFNFRYFDFSTAIKLPVLLHKKTKVLAKKGTIILPEKVRFGMIKFGYGGAVFDAKNKNSVWQLKGNIVFKGTAIFGNGTVVSVLENSKLIIGDKFSVGSNSKILCRKRIEFGDSCLLSWNVTVMDTDFHEILNENNQIINKPKSITIKDKVWIGCNVIILKGITIGKGSIIATNTVVSKSNEKENIIISGSKQQVIKENIKWNM